jgi:hypothetical protein
MIAVEDGSEGMCTEVAMTYLRFYLHIDLESLKKRHDISVRTARLRTKCSSLDLRNMQQNTQAWRYKSSLSPALVNCDSTTRLEQV